MKAKPQDPRKPLVEQPFPAQRQEPPGLEANMRPRPDYGEASYRGSGRLAGRRALVTGGDSGIGRAGQAAEMAPIDVLLASNESSYVTGMVYGATGGELMP